MPTAAPDRILTTHVGSLPRPPELAELLRRRERGELDDEGGFEAVLAQAVRDVVSKQVALGLDLVNDGEFGKPSYATYVQERLSGFGEVGSEHWGLERNREHALFPEFYQQTASVRGAGTRRKLGCIGPVALRDKAPLERDLNNLAAAAEAVKPVGCFMTAASPGVVARFHPNAYYASTAEYRQAVGEAMRAEYEAIVAAGFTLQLDCPDLGSGRNNAFAHLTDAEFLEECAISVEILNQALRNLPAERLRLHLCWGNFEGPHTCDIPLETILPVVLEAKPRIISFEGANPRHEHEWEVWTRVALPEDKAIMPGVIDSLTNFVEHPELVAQRVCRFADAVGRERVIAGADCGFDTFLGTGRVEPRIAYAKLQSLVEGARVASRRLWSAGRSGSAPSERVPPARRVP